MPRNLASTDDRRQRSIKCSTRCWTRPTNCLSAMWTRRWCQRSHDDFNFNPLERLLRIYCEYDGTRRRVRIVRRKGPSKKAPISRVIPAATVPKLFFNCSNEELLESDAATGGKSLHSLAHSVREINSCPNWSIRSKVAFIAKPMAKGCVS